MLAVKQLIPLFYLKCCFSNNFLNVTDDKFEFQVNESRTFEEIAGLDVMNDILDETSVAFFRERLRKVNVIDELYEML